MIQRADLVLQFASLVTGYSSHVTGLFCVRYSLDRNGGFLVDWSESAGDSTTRNYRRAKIVTVKRGYAATFLALGVRNNLSDSAGQSSQTPRRWMRRDPTCFQTLRR